MTDDMIYNTKYDFLDVSKYVKEHGKTTLIVPENYAWKKEIFSGIGKVNIYQTKCGDPFLIKAKSRNTDWALRMKCPNALSKYLRFHEQGKPSVYEIEYGYLSDKFIVTKKTGE